MLPTRTSIARKLIAQSGYNLSRMERMAEESTFYLSLAKNAKNRVLRDTYIATAKMYQTRSQYYFNHELRKSI